MFDQVPGMAVLHLIQRLCQPDLQVGQLGILGHRLNAVSKIPAHVLHPLLMRCHLDREAAPQLLHHLQYFKVVASGLHPAVRQGTVGFVCWILRSKDD
jgi:hypothetical protein